MEFSFHCNCGLSSRLEYKYSRLVMSANKECELPAADSCALAEGEEPDDDVVYAQKPSLLGKLRAIATKVCVFFPEGRLLQGNIYFELLQSITKQQ